MKIICFCENIFYFWYNQTYAPTHLTPKNMKCKKLLLGLSMAFVISAGASFAQSPKMVSGLPAATQKYFTMPAGVGEGDYMPNKLVFRMKPEYRSVCTRYGADVDALNTFIKEMGGYAMEKAFPFVKQPERAYNEFGQKLVDLTLIYTVRYTASVPVEKAVNKMAALGLFEYVEPFYIQKIVAPYNPNDPLYTNNSQYHIKKIKCDSAWGINTTTARGDTSVVIGITDTGWEPAHSDLIGNVKLNSLDPPGGGDQDGDGYVDNYKGWDVGMNDNNAQWQGDPHGVHVTGIAAAKTDNNLQVAGTGFKCKFLPVKIADASGALVASYTGITYAADHGCKVINCSWGGAGGGSFGQNAIDYATINKNCAVVAACGNNSQDLSVAGEFYPAGFKGVLSVCSTTSTDLKSGFSNYGYSVDIAAPGSGIVSTYSGQSTASLDGTSMASPDCAGALAIVRSFWPSLSALQAIEHIKNTTDYIDGINNPSVRKKMGKGRVNLYKALSRNPLTQVKSMVMTNHTETDGNDNTFVINDSVRVVGDFTNYLTPLSASATCSLSVMAGSTAYATMITSTYPIGTMATLQTKSNTSTPFRFRIMPGTPLNTNIWLQLDITDGAYTSQQFFYVTVNVDYINITINQVGSTITSKGLIGYNDNQGQLGGIGFTYKNSGTLLYDASVMIGTSSTKVSDRARSTTSTPDADFNSVQVVKKIGPYKSDFDVTGIFNDAGAGGNALPVQVHHEAFAWSAPPDDKYIMVRYAIRNTGGSTLANLYAGIIADWDITAASYDTNKANYDATNKMGYVYKNVTNGVYCGIKLLSSGTATHYAIDNITGGGGGVNAADGLDAAEKYTIMSTNRAIAGASGVGNDCIDYMGTGSFSIVPGDSIVIGFALLAGDNLADLQNSAQKAQIKWNGLTTGINNVATAESGMSLSPCYPNPASKTSTIEFFLPSTGQAELKLYNMVGEEVATLAKGELNQGSHMVNLDVTKLSNGIYYYQLTAAGSSLTRKVVVNK